MSAIYGGIFGCLCRNISHKKKSDTVVSLFFFACEVAVSLRQFATLVANMQPDVDE